MHQLQLPHLNQKYTSSNTRQIGNKLEELEFQLEELEQELVQAESAVVELVQELVQVESAVAELVQELALADSARVESALEFLVVDLNHNMVFLVTLAKSKNVHQNKPKDRQLQHYSKSPQNRLWGAYQVQELWNHQYLYSKTYFY